MTAHLAAARRRSPVSGSIALAHVSPLYSISQTTPPLSPPKVSLSWTEGDAGFDISRPGRRNIHQYFGVAWKSRFLYFLAPRTRREASCCSPWQVTCCQVIIPTCPSQGTRSPFSLFPSLLFISCLLLSSFPSRSLHGSSWSIVLLHRHMHHDAFPVFLRPSGG